MKSAKSLAVAAAIALASLTFASEAFAGVSIYFGPGGGYYGGPYYGYGYGYYPHAYPYYGYSYYPRYSYGYGPYWGGHWQRHWRRWH